MALQTQYIEYLDGGVVLEGYMAWDDASVSPMPGILIGHAWAGRSPFECKKAEELAKLGYVGFALDVYGKSVMGNNKRENAAPVSYTHLTLPTIYSV